jgi:hypothetical protein
MYCHEKQEKHYDPQIYLGIETEKGQKPRLNKTAPLPGIMDKHEKKEQKKKEIPLGKVHVLAHLDSDEQKEKEAKTEIPSEKKVQPIGKGTDKINIRQHIPAFCNDYGKVITEYAQRTVSENNILSEY